MGILFALFGGLSGTAKLIVIVGLLLGLVTTGGVIYAKIYNKGYDAAIADIGRANKRAVERAQKARSAVLDCDTRGLRWDTTTGKCQ